MISTAVLTVPNAVGGFGAPVTVSQLAARKTVQLFGPGADNVKVWASLDGSNFSPVQSMSGAIVNPTPLEVSCVAMKAQRVTGTTAGYGVVVAAEAAPDTRAALSWVKGPDSAASTTLSEGPIGKVAGARRIARIVATAPSVVNPNPVDFATMTLRAYTFAGASLGVIGTLSNDVTKLFAWTDCDFTLTAVLDLPDRATVSFELGKTGLGTQLPVVLVSVLFEP